MKYLIILFFSFFLLTSCNTKSKFLKAYEYAQENKDMNSRPGYKGKQCTVKIKAANDCKIVLETYKGFKFSTAYDWDLKADQYINETIKPNQYFIAVIIDGQRYDDFVFQTFAPAWEVNLSNYITYANNQHKNKLK